MSQPSTAGVSVIVAVRNAAASLQACIDSIRQQSHSPVEIFVVDGASTDGTVDLLRRNEDVLGWKSEPDEGIYDAWNKGIEATSGEWVCFLGADDQFAHPEALARMVKEALHGSAEIVTAKVAVVDSSQQVLRIIGEPWDWTRMKHHQIIAHPGALHRRELFTRHGLFNPQYRLSGDYEFLLRLGANVRSAYLGEVIVLMGASGVSRTAIGPLLRESWRIQSGHPEIGVLKATYNNGLSYAKAVARRILRRP